MRYLDPDYNPLTDDDVEKDYRKRIDQYVRDLVWGVQNNKWPFGLDAIKNRNIIISYSPMGIRGTQESTQYNNKWKRENIPSPQELWTFGYVSEHGVLTEKAFNLLHTPSTAPKVFISYRHIASSTLALAIEARLKNLGNNNTFIDKELSPGKRFDTQITDAIKNCSHFVLLVDDDLFALGSSGESWVKKEYELAVKEKKEIIPIIHNNALSKLPDFGKQGYDTTIQYIDCKGISAADYEFAINRLLNKLNYATY